MSKIQLIVILLSILNVFGNTLVNKESCNSGDKISLSGECIYYRLCENNSYITKKCPRKAINNIGELSQQMFDPIKKECVDKRKVVVSDKCNSYKECIINESISPIEKWLESYCPSTLHFDELTQKCIKSKLTNCTVCLSNLCKNDGICKEDNKKGGYECFCKPGFKGNNCEINSNKTVCFDSETYFTNGKGEHICNFLSDKKETEICEPKEPMTLEGHELPVKTVSFSPDGRFLASSALDYTIKIWNTTNGELLRTLTGHDDWVNSFSFSPNGKLLAGTMDETIKIWNPTNGQLLRTLTDQLGYVRSVSFSPDGKFLASDGLDNTIKIWNPVNGELLRTLTGHEGKVKSVSFSPDGSFLASGSRQIWSNHYAIKIWNPSNGKLLRTLTRDGCLFENSISPSGEFLVSDSADDLTIKIWNTSNGHLFRTLSGHDGYDINSVSYSPDGKFIASGSDDRTIKIWNPVNGELLRTLTGHEDIVTSVSISPNGKLIASGSDDDTIKIWNLCN